eukprot:TRINITY_DN8319_c0_g1_i1.p1 TRINITY_DN8319_c0_g1~~TRINITY_DN8319_c0_g1_i1.p1  ORF type:complete len:308 (-),score=70.02 TRINITY_DN8319_c0_g1_i1:281-1204(-)
MAVNRIGALFHSGEAYAAFRPSYVPAIFEHIRVFGGFSSPPSSSTSQAPSPPQERWGACMYDIGCGTGQAIDKLRVHFDRVVGVDTSEKQLQQARSKNYPNVAYQLQFGEEALEQAEPSSVSLITCAQAAHWFEDVQRFSNAATHALTPHGTLAVWGYTLPFFAAKHGAPQAEQGRINAANQLIRNFHDNALNGHWEQPGRSRVMNECVHLHPVLRRDFKHFEVHHVREEKDALPFASLVNYINTWSGLAAFRQKHPEEAEEEYRSLCAALKGSIAVTGGGEETTEAACCICLGTFVIPYFLILCKN